nr:vascular endothelial growth factor receptor 1 [Salvelinus alpinus]
MICFIFVVLCGLSGSALAKGKVEREPKGKFSVPVLDVKSRQLVLEANQTLTIHCRGRWELSWVFPGGVARDKESVQLEDSRCGRQSQHYCSQLIISSAQAQHTGSFRCRYSHRTRRQSAVYIYVTDRQRPFVREQNKSPDVVYIKESQPLVFPCRVTNPDATVSLVKFPDRELTPDQRNIVWNSRQGFLIRSPTYFYIGLFSCKTSVNGTTHSLSYLTHRQVNKIMEVYLNSTSPVQTLQGDSLAINCTVTAEWNSRVSISWDYPGQVNRAAIISRRIMASKTHMVFYSILSIPKLHRSDRGLYICRVTSGPVSRETNVSVTVYDPIISV